MVSQSPNFCLDLELPFKCIHFLTLSYSNSRVDKRRKWNYIINDKVDGSTEHLHHQQKWWDVNSSSWSSHLLYMSWRCVHRDNEFEIIYNRIVEKRICVYDFPSGWVSFWQIFLFRILLFSSGLGNLRNVVEACLKFERGSAETRSRSLLASTQWQYVFPIWLNWSIRWLVLRVIIFQRHFKSFPFEKNECVNHRWHDLFSNKPRGVFAIDWMWDVSQYHYQSRKPRSSPTCR